jgi:hypothetical protein
MGSCSGLDHIQSTVVCSPEANFGKPPRDEFVIGLRLCKEEWRRRHPKKSE